MSKDELKVEDLPFKKGERKLVLFEESKFDVKFPHNREKYLKENWKRITHKFGEYDIDISADYENATLTVKTTKDTDDPYSIIKAKHVIELLARSVDVEHSFKVFHDDIEPIFIRLNYLCPDKKTMIKRRQRLIGNDSATLKALELLTECYIYTHGNTVCAIGKYDGLREVKRVVEDCMKNVNHPVYWIKRLDAKRLLANDPNMKDKDWDKYLPELKKSTRHQNKKTVKHNKRNRGLPDFPKDSLIDKQIESGEYFLKKKSTSKKERRHKIEKQAVKPDDNDNDVPPEIELKVVSEALKE